MRGQACISRLQHGSRIRALRLRPVPVEFPVPRSESRKSGLKRRGRLEAEVPLQLGHVGERLVDVARLHGEQLLLARRADDSFRLEAVFKHLHKAHEAFGPAVADVVDFVRRAVLGLIGSPLHDVRDARYDVVDVGEVAVHVAVVVDLDRLAAHEPVRELEVRHVRPPHRAVDSEEAQPGRRNLVELAVGVRHQFVRLFCGGVERDGIVDLVVRGVGDFPVRAVDARRRGEDEVLHRVVAAGLEDVEEADDVRADVAFRVRDGVAHARLRRKVHGNLRLELGEQRVKRGLVGDVEPAEGEAASVFGKHPEPLLLERRVVVVRHAVRADDARVFHGVKDMPGKKASDESGRSRYEDCLVGKGNVLHGKQYSTFWGGVSGRGCEPADFHIW